MSNPNKYRNDVHNEINTVIQTIYATATRQGNETIAKAADSLMDLNTAVCYCGDSLSDLFKEFDDLKAVIKEGSSMFELLVIKTALEVLKEIQETPQGDITDYWEMVALREKEAETDAYLGRHY